MSHFQWNNRWLLLCGLMVSSAGCAEPWQFVDNVGLDCCATPPCCAPPACCQPPPEMLDTPAFDESPALLVHYEAGSGTN